MAAPRMLNKWARVQNFSANRICKLLFEMPKQTLSLSPSMQLLLGKKGNNTSTPKNKDQPRNKAPLWFLFVPGKVFHFPSMKTYHMIY